MSRVLREVALSGLDAWADGISPVSPEPQAQGRSEGAVVDPPIESAAPALRAGSGLRVEIELEALDDRHRGGEECLVIGRVQRAEEHHDHTAIRGVEKDP